MDFETLIRRMNIFPNLGVVLFFRFSSHFNRTFCAAKSGNPDQMQVWHLIWVCPVYLRRPTKGHLAFMGITDFNLSIFLAHKFNDVTAEEFT